jgi:hypothetical protein
MEAEHVAHGIAIGSFLCHIVDGERGDRGTRGLDDRARTVVPLYAVEQGTGVTVVDVDGVPGAEESLQGGADIGKVDALVLVEVESADFRRKGVRGTGDEGKPWPFRRTDRGTVVGGLRLGSQLEEYRGQWEGMGSPSGDVCGVSRPQP